MLSDLDFFFVFSLTMTSGSGYSVLNACIHVSIFFSKTGESGWNGDTAHGERILIQINVESPNYKGKGKGKQ